MLCEFPGIKPEQDIFVYLDGDTSRYYSRIWEPGPDLLLIDVPQKQEQGPGQPRIDICEGDSIRVQLPVAGQLYQFGSRVLHVGPDSGSPMGISIPGRIERVEMRRFVRVNKVLRVLYSELPVHGEEPDYKTAESLNISAGGMKLVLPEPVKQGSHLVIQFILSQDNKYSRFREVSRVTRTVSLPGENKFHVGVEFQSIKKNKLDLISRYVMRNLWTQAL